MSEPKYYELFAQKPIEDEQPRVLRSLPPSVPFTPYFPPNYPRQRQVFAEYNLWGPPAERQLGPVRSSIFNVGPKHTRPPIQVFLELPPKPMGPRPQMIQMPPTRTTPCMPYDTVDEAVEKTEPVGINKLEVTGVEKQKLVRMDKPNDLGKKVISKEILFADCSESEDDPEPADLSKDPETSNYRWESRSARVNNRGRTSNLTQRRLTRPLSKPVRMERGDDMMQRPGWNTGGLGRISDPVEPYALYGMDAGSGQYSPMVSPPLMPSLPPLPSPPPPLPLPLQPKALSPPAVHQGRNSRSYRFRTNFLKLILEFVEDDKCIELFFDKILMSSERKKIHKMVSSLENGEITCMLDKKQKQILSKIQIRKRYQLRTCNNFEEDEREICLFKQASAEIYVVISDDVRPCKTEIRRVEEEVNPFLKSIKKHIKEECGDILKPAVPYLLDKLIEYFLEFSDGVQYTEFRFLGPFTDKEIHVVDNFIDLITALSKQKVPGFDVPVELLHAFTKTYRFEIDKSFGDYVTIKKVHYVLRKEVNQQEEERQRQRMSHQRDNLKNLPYESTTSISKCNSTLPRK